MLALLSNLKKETVVHGYNHNPRLEKSIENQMGKPLRMYIVCISICELKNVDSFIIVKKLKERFTIYAM